MTGIQTAVDDFKTFAVGDNYAIEFVTWVGIAVFVAPCTGWRRAVRRLLGLRVGTFVGYLHQLPHGPLRQRIEEDLVQRYLAKRADADAESEARFAAIANWRPTKPSTTPLVDVETP